MSTKQATCGDCRWIDADSADAVGICHANPPTASQEDDLDPWVKRVRPGCRLFEPVEAPGQSDGAAELGRFIAAYDAWAQSSEHCGGPLFDEMLDARGILEDGGFPCVEVDGD